MGDHGHGDGHGGGHRHGPAHGRRAGAGEGPPTGSGRADHGGAGGDGRDRHGNPEDFERYLARLDAPDRVAWQKPDEVVAALGLAPGAVACDLGAGPGYFALRMARAVEPGGRVHAVDVEPRMLQVLAARARDAGLSNVHAHLAPDGDAAPPEPCDLVLLVNAFHHLRDGAATLRRLAARLRPGGRIAIVDFHGGELPVGPPPDHKVSRERCLAAVEEAGLAVAAEHAFLPYQYFVLLRPR